MVPSFTITVGVDGPVKNGPCCLEAGVAVYLYGLYMQLSSSQSRLGIGVMGASMTMMLVNIGVMCSAERNGKHIRKQINWLTGAMFS